MTESTPYTGTDAISDGFHTFGQLYAFRAALTALLFNTWAREGRYDVHKSRRHSDGSIPFGDPDWFIVVATPPTGQVSFHYRMAEWDRFTCPERERPAPWDDHDAAQALARLSALIDLEAVSH